MLDNEPTGGQAGTAADAPSTSTTTTTTTTASSATGTAKKTAAARTRRSAASRPAGPPAPTPEPTPAKRTRKAAATTAQVPDGDQPVATAKKTATKKVAKKSLAKKSLAKTDQPTPEQASQERASQEQADVTSEPAKRSRSRKAPAAPGLLFQPPEPTTTAPAPARDRSDERADSEPDTAPDASSDASSGPDDDGTDAGSEASRRRRRRGGRGRRGRGRAGDTDELTQDSAGEGSSDDPANKAPDSETSEDSDGEGGTHRRRRRRRRSGSEVEADDEAAGPERTVVHVREPRAKRDEITGVKGSTRLEAKRQRRREGREQGRRRPPVLTEAEFLARRESVDRQMVVRQIGDRTQIAVLEDGVLVEHYVARTASTGMAGNVYLGKVQNVLPSMEAAFVDIGRGRNAVLYAGEVNWDAAGLDGQPRRIEHALKSGDAVMVQVTKDPIGHKGARLTSQVSLPGRYLVYVPDGSMTGISRKLPDTERNRLKNTLKRIVPDDAGVIVRTASEGASEEELQRDVNRLAAQWEDIRKKAESASAPALLYEEPDLTIRVVRDVFNEDFSKLLVSGDDAWDMLDPYLGHVAPDLADRLSRWTDDRDVFSAMRIDEQLMKALDRKVWLPSGGYLVIDPTEAMTVVDVNTGKFTGSGGNLEETVTKNNIEAAEEIVRQLRLRDVGGIIVIDFIDMVLESNRELVLRRLTECLGRDRTKHQVAEVTSLGLVQMTRKRVGQGLLESFSTVCESCNGRGRHVHLEPVEQRDAGGGDRSRSGKGDRSPKGSGKGSGKSGTAAKGADQASEADPVEEPVSV
jgi:ribonuclease E